jgi:hypothetical protein
MAAPATHAGLVVAHRDNAASDQHAAIGAAPGKPLEFESADSRVTISASQPLRTPLVDVIAVDWR